NVGLDIRSRNTFGESGAMYDFWYPSQPPTDRPLILVGMKRDVLERNRAGNEIDLMLHEPSPIHYKIVTRNGTPLRCLYYCTAQGYRGNEMSTLSHNMR